MKQDKRAPATALMLFRASVLCVLAGVVSHAGAAAPATTPENVYEIVWKATLDPATQRAQVRIAVRQSRHLLRHVQFVAPRDRYLDVRGQGAIETTAEHIDWTPPNDGGVLHFEYVIDRERADGAPDARITDSWAMLKLDHMFPPATVRTLKGARSKATLRLVAPTGWSIETPYGPAAGRMRAVDDPHAGFIRPKGWMVAGSLAVRRDVIVDRRVAVASPQGSGFRSNDTLAFVRWTLPSLVEVFPDFPARLLIVSGPDSMWRGGLSGARSMYLHADRPLISQNGTSTPLHELVHVASGLHGAGGADWIVEGTAEYYSLELLRRSNAISARRFDRSLATLARWSEGTKCVATDRSQGMQTAHAAGLMYALDREIRSATHERKSLDDLMRTLVDARAPVTNAGFRAAAVALVGAPPKALAGCP